MIILNIFQRTVYGETDANGRYTLRFPDGTLNDKYMYGYVVNPNGEVQTHTLHSHHQFRSPMANSSFVPQSRPGQNLIVNPMWYNLNFALVPQNDVKIDITNYNNTTKPARPGDVAQIDLSGTHYHHFLLISSGEIKTEMLFLKQMILLHLLMESKRVNLLFRPGKMVIYTL